MKNHSAKLETLKLFYYVICRLVFKLGLLLL